VNSKLPDSNIRKLETVPKRVTRSRNQSNSEKLEQILHSKRPVVFTPPKQVPKSQTKQNVAKQLQTTTQNVSTKPLKPTKLTQSPTKSPKDRISDIRRILTTDFYGSTFNFDEINHILSKFEKYDANMERFNRIQPRKTAASITEIKTLEELEHPEKKFFATISKQKGFEGETRTDLWLGHANYSSFMKTMKAKVENEVGKWKPYSLKNVVDSDSSDSESESENELMIDCGEESDSGETKKAEIVKVEYDDNGDVCLENENDSENDSESSEESIDFGGFTNDPPPSTITGIVLPARKPKIETKIEQKIILPKPIRNLRSIKKAPIQLTKTDKPLVSPSELLSSTFNFSKSLQKSIKSREVNYLHILNKKNADLFSSNLNKDILELLSNINSLSHEKCHEATKLEKESRSFIPLVPEEVRLSRSLSKLDTMILLDSVFPDLIKITVKDNSQMLQSTGFVETQSRNQQRLSKSMAVLKIISLACRFKWESSDDAEKGMLEKYMFVTFHKFLSSHNRSKPETFFAILIMDSHEWYGKIRVKISESWKFSLVLIWHDFYYNYIHQKKWNHHKNWITDTAMLYAPNFYSDAKTRIGEKDKQKMRKECLSHIFSEPKKDFFAFELFSTACYFIKFMDILTSENYLGEPVLKLVKQNLTVPWNKCQFSEYFDNLARFLKISARVAGQKSSNLGSDKGTLKNLENSVTDLKSVVDLLKHHRKSVSETVQTKIDKVVLEFKDVLWEFNSIEPMRAFLRKIFDQM
jgi:hypothetical protein